jgi:hypothetical protein
MGLDGPLLDAQFKGDLAIGASEKEQLQYLVLPRGEVGAGIGDTRVFT